MYVSTNECIILAPCCLLTVHRLASKQAGRQAKLSFFRILCAPYSVSFSHQLFAHPSKKVSIFFNHDSGSLRLQSSFARIPRCFAYPWKSVSTFLPNQHIVPPLRSVSRGRSSTAETVQAAAECRLLRLLKKLFDGCSVFPSP